MQMKNLPTDVFYHFSLYLCLSDIAKFICTSKSNELVEILCKKLANQKNKLKTLKEKIIEIYSDNAVKTLNFSGDVLWKNQIFPLMTDVHILRYFIIAHWVKNENEIISTFSSEYISHYKNHSKMFKKMPTDCSFVVSIAMSLYH